jgi:ankyrin repeat protein
MLLCSCVAVKKNGSHQDAEVHPPWSRLTPSMGRPRRATTYRPPPEAWREWYGADDEQPRLAPTGSGDATLLWAVGAGAHHVVEQLASSAGANMLTRDALGRLPLSVASAYGHPEVVRVLLAHGSWANSTDARRRTPLMWAAACGNQRVCELLLAGGADPGAGDEDRVTSLMVAAGGGHVEVVQTLLGAGVPLGARANDNCNALVWAVRSGQHAACQALLTAAESAAMSAEERQHFLAATDSDGRSVVAHAVCCAEMPERRPTAACGQLPCVAALCKAGTELDGSAECRGAYMGATPLLHAARLGSTQVLARLLAHGAAPHARLHDGRCALSLCAVGMRRRQRQLGAHDAAGSSNSGGGGCPHTRCARELLPALRTTMTHCFEAWLLSSGTPDADAAAVAWGDQGTATERLVELLRGADLEAWCARCCALSPPLRPNGFRCG